MTTEARARPVGPDPLTLLRAIYGSRHQIPTVPEGYVGFFSPMVPQELILAAGMIPWRMQGNPGLRPTLSKVFLEPEVDGEVRSVFDQLLLSRLDHMPLMLMPRGSEQYLRLYYTLLEMRKWGEYEMPPLKLVDILQGPSSVATAYTQDRLRDVGKTLSVVGRPFDDDHLRQAIRTVNDMRRALQKLNALRREGRFSGADMQRITALFGVLTPNEFLNLTSDLHQMAQRLPVHTGPRLMLSGMVQDKTRFYDGAQVMGAQVVADDHITGERIYAHLVDETAPPWRALTDHYQHHVPSLRQYPQRRLDQDFLRQCRAARVDAVLCVLENCDDTLRLDWPNRRDALEAMGIPNTLLTDVKYFTFDKAAFDTSLSGLIEQLEGATP